MQSCCQRAIQVPHNGYRQQLHFVPHFIQMFKEMSYVMGIDSGKPGKVCYNCLPDRNILCDDDYTQFFLRNPVKCIEFLMQEPEFTEHMSYAPPQDYIEAEERIYSEVKSSDWWWNKQVR